MHKERADIFFYQALEILKETKEPHNLLIFVVSSVTTFLIVTATRILIRLSKKTGVTHFEIETELDRYFMVQRSFRSSKN